MATAITTEEFLSHKKLALVRLSAGSPVMGAKMDEELRPKGYEVSVVYLKTGASDAGIEDVKGKVDGAIIAVPKSECAAAVKEAIDAGIPRLWLQSGCDSKEALALCEEKGVPVVHGACVLMYAQPVKSVHAFHRGLWKMFGLVKK
jgi:uncharacterized protein